MYSTAPTQHSIIFTDIVNVRFGNGTAIDFFTNIIAQNGNNFGIVKVNADITIFKLQKRHIYSHNTFRTVFSVT